MDDKCIDVMKHYYKLKQQYDSILQKQKQKIMNNDTLSKKDKRERFKLLQPKCINCKKPGGTIFKNTNERLKAVCGSAEPCNLNIELFKSKFTNSREEFRFYTSDLERIKTYIIMTKLDFLFGYKSEEETIREFEKKKLDSIKIIDKIYQLENTITNITHNKENEKLVKHIETMQHTDIHDLKQLYKTYVTDKNSEIIKDMVELYLTKIKPQSEEIRKLKYMYTGIENDDDIYTLVEEPYTIAAMEIPDEKCMIASNTV